MKNYNVSDEPVTKVAVDIDDIKDTSREKSLNKECVFLIAGRMIYRKGLDFLFDALMRIPQETRYQVRVVGDGPELEHLRKRCKDDLNLSEHVHCMGSIPYMEMEKEYACADVFIMPSIRETTGTVLLEAMSKGMALPIRNMINTMYAKDISKKVWSSLQRKKEAGYAVGSDAPFGYIRNPVTKRNEIDPETAFYVQLIFQWALMGVAIYEIARRMTLLQVPTPREWHRKIVEGKDVVTYKKWGETSIRHMLANQTYVGDTINNKSTQRFFAGQDKRDLSKEQWYVAKNTHPAIIARDDFEKVQEILTKNQKVFKTVRAESEQIRTEYQNDLAGMVFCADCGRPMDFDRLPHGAEESKKVCYYICRARQADDKCIGHQITEKLAHAITLVSVI